MSGLAWLRCCQLQGQVLKPFALHFQGVLQLLEASTKGSVLPFLVQLSGQFLSCFAELAAFMVVPLLAQFAPFTEVGTELLVFRIETLAPLLRPVAGAAEVRQWA